MKYCAFVLFCAGAVTAEEGLSIKMPEAIAAVKTAPLDKAQEQKAIVSGASPKSMIKAKTHKISQFLQKAKGEYEEGTEDQKKAIQAKAVSLMMNSASVRDAGGDLCPLLWSSATELAGKLSFFFCPSLVFPTGNADGTPLYAAVSGSPASRMRSAFLTKFFWAAILGHDSSGVIEHLAPSVCYYAGNGNEICGIDMVSKTLPYIGFPQTSHVSDPVYWHCDTTTCIAPVKAWAEHQNYCLTAFDSSGLVTEAIIPLTLWR